MAAPNGAAAISRGVYPVDQIKSPRHMTRRFAGVHWASSLGQQSAKSSGGTMTVDHGGGHIQDQGFPGIHLEFIIDQTIVLTEEYHTRGESGSLVAIHKRVVVAQIIQAGRGHLDQIGHDRISAEGCLGSRNGTLEQGFIPQPRAATMRLEHFLMNHQDRVA